jgi:hypothetical protein
MIYLALWVYWTLVKTDTIFSPLELIRRVEEVMFIECLTPLNIVVDVLPNMTELEAHLVHLEHLDEKHHDAATMFETHKNHVKGQYDKYIHPMIFSKGDLVLVYDQEKDAIGEGKFNLMLHDHYIMRNSLHKGYYELSFYEGNLLWEP